MIIKAIEFNVVRLPFRFAFKHSLASRSCSENIIAKTIIESSQGESVIGWGEGIPRDYVTGETVESALGYLRGKYAPCFIGREIYSLADTISLLHQEFSNFALNHRRGGSAWCALELSLLDAMAKAHIISLTTWLSDERKLANEPAIRYGGVVPFSNKYTLPALLLFYRLYGFKTIKLKMGNDESDNLACLKLARSIMGSETKIRIDANCAWTVAQTLKFAGLFDRFGVISIEQPVAATDLEGLATITRNVPQQIVADESLCTIEQAENLARQKACNAFNIRISKVGGLLAADKIREIACQSGIACHLGAQVGESGILTAAGRTFAFSTAGSLLRHSKKHEAGTLKPVDVPGSSEHTHQGNNQGFDNYEGAANFFLLKQDLTTEDFTAKYGAIGKPSIGPGFGFSIDNKNLMEVTQSRYNEDLV